MKHFITTTALMSVLFLNPTNDAEAAMKKTVSFESNGQTLPGNLYLPDNYKEGDKLPGVVVTGAWTSVKEQMPAGYAEKIADKGYAALAFDFRGWGEAAKNAPENLKYVENPEEKTKDIVAAANYLMTRPEVNSEKLATLGICASSGYAINAANQNSNIKTVATVAPWLHDAGIVKEQYGDEVSELKKATAKAKEEGPEILEAAGKEGSGAVMEGEGYYTDPNRGAIPEYDNKFSTLSWGPWLNYDAVQIASNLSVPVLLVHSEKAAIPQGAKKFASEGGDKVKLIMLEDVTQFDFYDQEEPMTKALNEVDKHFKNTL